MRGSTGRWIAAPLALLALIALPAPAMAREGLDMAFHLQAANGYKITVGGYESTALISAFKRRSSPRRQEWSTYVARGKVSKSAIHASFGDLGSVAMHFRPSGKITHSKQFHHCHGPDHYTNRLGVFVGSLRFRGEGGYTSVRVHRVSGAVSTPRFLRCADAFSAAARRQPGSRQIPTHPSPKVTQLRVESHVGLTITYALAVARGSRAKFGALMEQTEGSLGVFRGAITAASPKTFVVDSALGMAGVTPPAPFSGTGSFLRSPTGERSWTGSLAVSFPGAPNVPLTGPQFKTQLTRGL